MEYEICKKLKDAGFPQNCENTTSEHLPDSPIPYYERSVADPDLSTLIKECGPLTTLIMLRYESFVCYQTTDYAKMETAYSTPEEAVARLWLQLNNF